VAKERGGHLPQAPEKVAPHAPVRALPGNKHWLQQQHKDNALRQLGANNDS
jgi:hypothetical protein